MLIARAPMRISFFGGGTDLPAYYEQYGGAVLSTSINKYVYVIVSSRNIPRLQLISADYRTFYHHHTPEADFIWNGSLDLPKRIFFNFGLRQGLNIFIASEVPPGTGLGSSSSVAVASIAAAAALRGLNLSSGQLAELASHTEIVQLEMPIGKQDQYAAAFGGLNQITFSRQGAAVTPLSLSAETLSGLREGLTLFYTGSSRISSTILAGQSAASRRSDADVIAALDQIKRSVGRGRDLLEQGDLAGFAALMDETWQQKKRLSAGISNPTIDGWYDLARTHGALGGKITGAGGGGFLMLFCPPNDQPAMSAALEAAGLQRMDFGFDRGGARVILNTLANDPDRQQALSADYQGLIDSIR